MINSCLPQNKSVTDFQVAAFSSSGYEYGIDRFPFKLLRAFLLQKRCTLKKFGWQLGFVLPQQEEFTASLPTSEENQEFVELIRNNVIMEEIDLFGEENDKTLEAFLELNRAGRKYIREDPQSIEKWLGVLQAVNDNLDALFLHLQEHPMIGTVRQQQSMPPSPTRGVKRKATDMLS